METIDKENTWKDLPSGVRHKRSKLLCEKIGLTTFNCGINVMMCDILKPYKILTEQLQTQSYQQLSNRPSDPEVCVYHVQMFEQNVFVEHSFIWRILSQVNRKNRCQRWHGRSSQGRGKVMWVQFPWQSALKVPTILDNYIEHVLDDLREKYVNKRVSERFQDNKAGGIVRPYKGEVTDESFRGSLLVSCELW